MEGAVWAVAVAVARSADSSEEAMMQKLASGVACDVTDAR
jgi:hypothetical protein